MFRKSTWEIILLLTILFTRCIGIILPNFYYIGKIASSSLLLYWIVYLLVKDDYEPDQKNNILYDILVALRFLTPIIIILFTFISYKVIPHSSIERKEASGIKTAIPDSICFLNHYGIYKVENDTIEHVRLNDVDFEIRNKLDSFRLEWSSPCSYILTRKNGNIEICTLIGIQSNLIYVSKIYSNTSKELVLMERLNK